MVDQRWSKTSSRTGLTRLRAGSISLFLLLSLVLVSFATPYGVQQAGAAHQGEQSTTAVELNTQSTPNEPSSLGAFVCEPFFYDVDGIGMEGEHEATFDVPGTPNTEAIFQFMGRNYRGPTPDSVTFVDSAGTSTTLDTPTQIEMSNVTNSDGYSFEAFGVVGPLDIEVNYPTNKKSGLGLITYFEQPSTTLYSGNMLTHIEYAYRSRKPIASMVVDLPEPLVAPTDVTVKFAVTDLNQDGRVIYVRAEAGGQSAQLVIDGQNKGDLLTIDEVTIPNVPAGTDSVTVIAESPTRSELRGDGLSQYRDGDSVYLMGASVYHECQGERGTKITFDKKWVNSDGSSIAPPAGVRDEITIIATSFDADGNRYGSAECVYAGADLVCEYKDADGNPADALHVPDGGTYIVTETGLPAPPTPRTPPELGGITDQVPSDDTACTPNPWDDLVYTLEADEANGTYFAIVTNTSADCTYDVGLASYRKYDSVIDNQELYDWETTVLGPGEEMRLEVSVPRGWTANHTGEFTPEEALRLGACEPTNDSTRGDCIHTVYNIADETCRTQIDLFFGELLTSLYGQRYGERLLAYENTEGLYCKAPESFCPANITDLKVSDANGNPVDLTNVSGQIFVEAVSEDPDRPLWVAFTIEGEQNNVFIQDIEGYKPFFLMGDDSNGQPFGWDTSMLPAGTYKLSAVPYNDYGVACGDGLSLSFAVTPPKTVEGDSSEPLKMGRVQVTYRDVSDGEKKTRIGPTTRRVPKNTTYRFDIDGPKGTCDIAIQLDRVEVQDEFALFRWDGVKWAEVKTEITLNDDGTTGLMTATVDGGGTFALVPEQTLSSNYLPVIVR